MFQKSGIVATEATMPAPNHQSGKFAKKSKKPITITYTNPFPKSGCQVIRNAMGAKRRRVRKNVLNDLSLSAKNVEKKIAANGFKISENCILIPKTSNHLTAPLLSIPITKIIIKSAIETQ